MFSYLIRNWKLKFKRNLIVAWDFNMVLAVFPKRKKRMGHGHVVFQGVIYLGDHEDMDLLSIAAFFFT